MKNSYFFKKLAFLLAPLLFLLVGIITLQDYGINWDNAQHFNRGQAYLRYIFTGQKNYLDLPAYTGIKGSSDFANTISDPKEYETPPREGKGTQRVSYFMSDYFNGEYFLDHDSGHPPTSDIISALFNYVFYQKLNIFPDTDSYHLYILFICFLGLSAVSYLLFVELGFLASLVGTLSVCLYPLFFAESHFNIKDPVESSLIALMMVFFYFGVKKEKPFLILFSSLFAGLGLGTKFNIVFIFVGITIYFMLLVLPKILFKGNLGILKKNILYYLSFLFFPVIVLLILYLSWPYLWENTYSRFKEIVGFYQTIGTGILPELERFVVHNINTYPAIWIYYSTPIIVLFLSSIGFITGIIRLKKNPKLYLIFFIWFLVPILRVSIGQTSIYGGVRQIMEYIFPMGIYAALGFDLLRKYFINKKLVRIYYLLIVLCFVFLGYGLYKIHPYQNMFFNRLAGGLSGMNSKNIPSAVNSFGSAYQDGVNYLNNNAQKNAKLSLLIGNMVNVARPRLRNDIDFSNSYFSGYEMEGEYLMEIYFDKPYRDWFTYSYAENLLLPVYEKKIDGISVVKVWKNDPQNSLGIKGLTKIENISYEKEQDGLVVDLKGEHKLGKIGINFSEDNCNKEISGFVYVGKDMKDLTMLPEFMDKKQSKNVEGNEDFYYFFAGLPARFIVLETKDEKSCLFNSPSIAVWEIFQKR